MCLVQSSPDGWAWIGQAVFRNRTTGLPNASTSHFSVNMVEVSPINTVDARFQSLRRVRRKSKGKPDHRPQPDSSSRLKADSQAGPSLNQLSRTRLRAEQRRRQLERYKEEWDQLHIRYLIPISDEHPFHDMPDRSFETGLFENPRYLFLKEKLPISDEKGTPQIEKEAYPRG